MWQSYLGTAMWTSSSFEPCLLEYSTNYCEWTIFPKSFNMFFKIVPQFICIVTNDVETTSMYQVFQKPNIYWSFILKRDHLLFSSYENFLLRTQMLFPSLSIPNIRFSLEPLCKILQGTKELQNFTDNCNCVLMGTLYHYHYCCQ